MIARSFLDPPFCSTPEQSSLSSDPYYNHTPARANPRQYSSVQFQLSVKTGLQDVGLQSLSALRKLQLFTSIIILVSSPCKSRVFVKYHIWHCERKPGKLWRRTRTVRFSGHHWNPWELSWAKLWYSICFKFRDFPLRLYNVNSQRIINKCGVFEKL